MSARTSLSGMDVAFLSLETPSTPMNVMATFLLDASNASGGYSYERILALVEERLPRLDAFRRRLAAVPFGLDHPVWIDDPDFDVHRHVFRVKAPTPGSDRVLAAVVAKIAARPLDRTRPLWELRVVEGLTEGRVALVFKLHHAVADGVSANRLLLEVLDPSAEGAENADSLEPVQTDAAPTNRALLAHALGRVPQQSARLARLLRDSAGTLAGMARPTVPGDVGGPEMPMPFRAPRLPWNAATSPRRTAAYARAQLADVKLVNSVFGTTVNHVVLAACTQTLRSYLEAHGGVPETPLVAAIPLSLRSPDDTGAHGNRISAFLVHLPVQLADPVEQLLAVRDGAESARQNHAQLGVGALGEWAEFTSSRLLGAAARLYSAGQLAKRHRPLVNLVISNVRGPEAPLFAAGARLIAAYPFGPLMEGAGMNITVVSYAGSIDFGVIACARSVPHVSDIAIGFSAAIADLTKMAVEQKSQPRSKGRQRRAPAAAPPTATPS
jgi:WS/DGAT/MGAT family acyltransferase